MRNHCVDGSAGTFSFPELRGDSLSCRAPTAAICHVMTDRQEASHSIKALSLLCLSLSPGITNGKWSLLEHHGALWTFLRGAISITSFAGGLCETLCKVSRLIFPVVNCQNLCCNRTMFTLRFIQTGFIHSIMHSERILHTFKSS